MSAAGKIDTGSVSHTLVLSSQVCMPKKPVLYRDALPFLRTPGVEELPGVGLLRVLLLPKCSFSAWLEAMKAVSEGAFLGASNVARAVAARSLALDSTGGG